MEKNMFGEVVSKQIDLIKETLLRKALEYSRNEDALHNFNQGVKMSTTDESREEIIWGMARKHWISLIDIRQDVKNGNLPTEALLDEKYTDMINYLIIEKASIMDKINEGKSDMQKNIRDLNFT